MASALAEHSTTRMAYNNWYYVLSDRFKLLFHDMTDEDYDDMMDVIQRNSITYDFDFLFREYELRCYNSDMESDVYDNVKGEFIYIISILRKARDSGVYSLSDEVAKRLLKYIDDWCLRDGIYEAWEVAEKLRDRASRRMFAAMHLCDAEERRRVREERP
ncbi:hypothetical protein ENUP19_0131G0011 [Entamoeba nuttalli]|uniref:Uncharacterized protein n=1 Tax=Entamoeba nuttalli TaxID=412467 RepID=A0ABQ0DJU4_9EUKA